MTFLSSAGLTLVLLASPAQAAPPSFAECEAASPRVDLLPGTTGTPHKACISASLVTVLSFNTEISRDAVVLQGRDRFEKVEVSASTIVLKPKHNLSPGERFLISVSFLDGKAPVSATFLLIAHPALATRQIDVFRHARPVEAYQQEAQELRAENEHLRSRVKQLEDQTLTRGGLTDLLANDIIGNNGITTSKLENLVGMHGHALDIREILSVRALDSRRVALSLRLSQPRPQEWSLQEIFLADEHGGVFKPMTWLGQGPIPPDNVPYAMILEWQLKGTEAARPFTLVLVGTDGRTVRVGKIVFPQ